MTEYAYRVSRLGPYREDPVRHYGLAVDISRGFICLHLERSDIEQEALTALCAAARTFDPDRGYAFSTWAGRLIRPHTHQGTHMTQDEIFGLAEAMLYGFDLQDPACETAIRTRPDARNCGHWDLKEIAALADDLSIPTATLDEPALERLADAYAKLADSFAE